MNQTKGLAITWGTMCSIDSYMSYPVMGIHGLHAEQNPIVRSLLINHGLNVFLVLGGISLLLVMGILFSRIKDNRIVLISLAILVALEIWGLSYTIPDFLALPVAWWDIRGWM